MEKKVDLSWMHLMWFCQGETCGEANEFAGCKTASERERNGWSFVNHLCIFLGHGASLLDRVLLSRQQLPLSIWELEEIPGVPWYRHVRGSRKCRRSWAKWQLTLQLCCLHNKCLLKKIGKSPPSKFVWQRLGPSINVGCLATRFLVSDLTVYGKQTFLQDLYWSHWLLIIMLLLLFLLLIDQLNLYPSYSFLSKESRVLNTQKIKQ